MGIPSLPNVMNPPKSRMELPGHGLELEMKSIFLQTPNFGECVLVRIHIKML